MTVPANYGTEYRLTSLIALMLRGYCQAIVRLLSLHERSPLSHTIKDLRSCLIPLTTNMSDELITPLCHKSSPLQ